MSGWKCGTASVVFTPDEPFWLAGYAARTAPAKGKVSDLRAKALALEDAAGERFVLLAVDLIAVVRPIADAVARHVEQKHRLGRERLLFAASHTHYGPEIRPEKAPFFGIPDDYARKIPAAAERVRAALVEVADRALADLKPARLVARQTTATFAANRRAVGDVIDHDVPVLDVLGEGGRRLAVVFGYACHNTTIPADDLRYCGDWAGFAQEQVERDHPGCTALFVTGAAADQNPHPRGTVDLSRAYGAQLAGAVNECLASPGGREVAPRLRVAYEDVSLPLERVERTTLEQQTTSPDAPVARKAKFLLAELARGPLRTHVDAPLQAVRLGDEVLLVALSGEPVNDFAHHFKTDFAAGGRLVWVAGYCNDMFGYVPTRRIQREGGYEGGRAMLWSVIPAPFDETVEDRVVAAVKRIVERVGKTG